VTWLSLEHCDILLSSQGDSTRYVTVQRRETAVLIPFRKPLQPLPPRNTSFSTVPYLMELSVGFAELKTERPGVAMETVESTIKTDPLLGRLGLGG
jgi:hypothetical protein